MTFHVFFAGNMAQLDTDRQLIKASERQPIAEAIDVLRHINDHAGDHAEALDREREDARRDGFSEGFEAAREQMVGALQGLVQQIEVERQRRNDEIASAAYAAVQAMLGTLPADVLTPALARQAAAHLMASGDTTIVVAPPLVEKTRIALADLDGVSVVEDPELGPLDCVIRSGKGYVLASMETQLAALAERWGLADVIVPERHG